MKKITKIAIVSASAVGLAGATAAAFISCKQPCTDDLKPAEPFEQPAEEQPTEPELETPVDQGDTTSNDESFKITVTATAATDVILRKDADNSYILSLSKGTHEYVIPILYLGVKGLAIDGVYKWNQKSLTFEAN
jgi:hypothetical protein